MPDNVDKLFEIMQANGAANDRDEFRKVFLTPGNKGYKIRKDIYDGLRADGIIDSPTYEDFRRKLRLGGTPTVNKYRQQMFNAVDPNKSRASELTHRAVGQAVRATNNVRKPVTAKVVNQHGKPTGKEFAITPAKTVEDLDREYAQETTKNWENELHDQMADADKDAAKISDMFKSFIGSTDEVGSVWGNMTRGGGIAGTPHSVTTNNGILENTEARQILAAGDYNRKRRELLQLEKDSRNGAIFDNHSFFRGMYDAAKDTGFLTGGASDLINAGSLLATKQDLDNGVHTEAGDMLMQQAVKNSDAQSQYGDNQGWMYTGGVITTNMAPFMMQVASAGFSKGMSNAIGKVVQGAASKVALGTMEKATGMAGAHIANYIGKVTGLTTKAFGKAIQYGIVGAAQANTVGLGNVANDVINRYTGQVYHDEQGNYKFGTFDSDGKLVHEGGEDFLTALVKGEAAQTIEFATELAGGGIDAAGTALKNFVTKGGKKIIEKYNMENVSKVINFLLNNKVSKNARYLKAGADRTLGKVELNSIVGESLEEELGIIANTVFTGDNKISDLWDEKQQSQIWGGMLLSIGLMKGAVAPFHAYNAKQYYSYKHKLDKADVNLSQLLGKEKWEELRNQIDATTNDDMPEMVNKINRDVALGKNRQPVREYIQNLLIMRGYDIGNMLAAKKAVEDKGEGVSVKNMEKNQAYQQGRDAYGYDTHEIQLDQEDKQKSLAQLLGISEQQLASMSDEELETLSGRDDNIDRAIYDYQLSTARYEGVIDNARDQIDLEVQRAAQAVDMYTDKSRNTIRNATIKATGGLEDYGVYIINGNIATHEDGSIDISNSDDMILYYDPTTNTVEHADAMMFAELGSEENADEVRSQAMADAKEKAIKETTGIIDGVVEVGTQFKTVDDDGTEHTYEVLADNGDGTAMITIDGNIPTELVKGENINVPVSFEELQKMKDESDKQRLQAAKAQREQMEKERAEQQMQAQTTQAENPAQEDNIQSAPIEDNLDYSDIIREDGKVQMVDVSDKDGNNLFPDAKDVFYIQGNKMRTKFAYIDTNGELKTQSFPTGLVKIKTRGEVSVDDYKKYRNMILSAESSAMPETSMIEDNSGENRGEIEVEAPTIEGEVAAPESAETPATEQTPAAPAITLEDGTIVPMLEDGNPDFSKLTAEQTAELYDSQFGEDADSIVSGYVSDAKKALDKASNMTVKGKTFVEQKAAKDAKEKAIADAQAAYDSAIAIRDAYNERQLAKVEDTAEGRKNLIEKARRKFARLKSAVKDDAEAVAQLYKETVGNLLHRLYDGTGIDVTDTIPLTAEEYVASNLGAHSLNYEGTETSKGVKQETGLSREDFAKTQLLAANGKGTTIDALVHSLWENRPSNLESLDTQDIRNAMLSVITSGFNASEAKNYIENLRIAQAENFLEEQKKAADNAAFAEENKAEPEQQTETAPESEEKAGEENSDEINDEENEKINEQTNENINAPEVPEDATDENPLGLQLSEDKVPFLIDGGKSGATYDINDKEDRQRLVAENSVDENDILDIDMPKHVHKAIKELCKKMGLKVQFLYMGARLNGWVENGTMYLALDANKATQCVFGHEMTHAIKQKNPEAYKELVKVAMAVTTKKKFEEDLAKVYQIYHDASGYNDIDDFVEEVIADNIGKFINDHDFAQRFALRLNHPVLATILHAIQKIKGLLYGDFYKSVDALERIVEKAYVDTANGQVTNSETGEDVSFSLRQKPEPKKKGIGYKVFVLKDGKLYPPMVANPDGAETPVGVWLDADAAPIAGESKTGRPQVKQGGKGTQGGSGKLAYRPGWHLGVVPYAIQFNRKDAEGNKTLFPKNFVFAEVEYAADVDYQEEARQEGINPSGKYQHSLAGLKHLPTDGYYMYRTNPNPETDPWVITGAMKVNRILTRAEQAELVKNAGREPQQIQEGDIVTDDVVNSINQEIAAAPKFSLKSKSVRFEAGKKLSDEEKKEVLSTLKDAYKVNGVPYHIEETAGGKEKRVYEPTADSYVVSDITNRPLRYYITLPDGRVAHPTEVYPNISDNEVKSSANKQGLLDDEIDQIISAAIGNMKDIADNAKAVEILNELQNLPHETHDVGYGLNHARSYNYKTGIFTSDAAQAIDYVVRRMRRKEDVPTEIPAALKKAVADSYGMVDNLIDGMSNTKVGADEIKPVSVGVFGNVYNQFRGKAKAAIEFLKKLGSGEATAALHHHTIGDISLVWGDRKTGLDKILRKHPEVVDNLQSIIDSMEVVQESDNRIKLESPTHFAVVSKEYKGEPREQWLLTAYEKRESLENGKSMDTATSSLGGDTALSQSKESAAKIDNSSETAKENGEKFSLKDEKIKSVAEKFGVNEDDVAMYANAVERGSTADAARARANIKRYLLQANEDKISSFKELMKYTVPVNEALKENFGDLDAMIEERRKQVEAQRNAMEAARKRAQEEEEKRQKHLDELSLIPTDELDKRYMDAIANNDESTAREMLDESARRKGYGDVDSDYQGQGAWAAPSNPQYESDEARRADIENSPDVNLEDIALGYSLQPDDYFDNPRAYMNNTAYGLESAHVIKNALDAIKNGEKDVKVKVYRAVPTSVKEGKLRNGDWVTPSKKYAEMHGDNRLEGTYRIIEDEVPANQLWWDGNDANEFGFDDGKEYRYKNAKNNRKLNDLITYDNKGNVIPPSKRFNSRKNDIRFSLAGERGAAAADKAEERTARMDNLSVARKMEEEKKDAKAIKMATGWERGADGKWRYEMPDAKIKDTMDVGGGHIVKRYEDDMLWNGGKLSRVIDAPELFKAYPQLKDVRIDTDAIMNDMPSNGEYNSKTNTITIHADDLKYMNGILNHEIQHAIQDIEGFAKGGSPILVRGEVKKRFDEVTKQIKQLRAEGKEDEAKALIEKNRGLYNAYQKNDDYNSYKSLAGEVEARNVSARLNMTPEERRKSLAESTEDVARKDQIFLGVGDVSFSLRDMADGKESGAADIAEDLKSLNTPDEVDDAIKTAIDDMPSGWQMANKKMIHIAQALGENRKAEIAGEEPKFSLKDGTLIKAGTYFSGGGLVEEGLKGIIDPVVAVEYDEKISGVYRNNFGQHIVTADVRDVDPKELVKQIDGEVEYFHASPVCKNYSQAKSNHAEVELDKETAASTAEFINAVKPKVVTIENVKGYKDSEAMKTITDALDANGYTWDADVYNAADYGGYTNRERLIVRAVRDGKLPEKPKKMARKSGWYEAVADIIPTLTEKKNGVAPWMDIRLKADGIDWRNIDKPLYVMGSAYADGKVPHAFADELLPTLRTKSGDVIVMPDGKVYRAMGRVLARVSGVSDDYKMPFSENLSHTIIGNGIPTQLTEHVIAPLLQNTLHPTTPEDGNTKFSLRGSTLYDKQMEEWMEKNHLEKGAVPMEKPIMKEGENIFDYANRMVEWTRNQNLWKTAPKQTGFQDALDKWKADNGLSPDAYPPVRPHRENYSTEIGYAEDLEEYNKKKELWKSAPKPKDFDLSVDLEDMNKQLRNIRRAVLNQKNYDQRTVKAVSDLVRKMLNIGWGDGLSRGKVGNLLSAAKNATGANDVKKYLDNAMGILAENYLNRLSTAYDNLINTKGARADQSGVIKMGSLDAKGQAFMSEYKKAINMDDSSLNTYIANIEDDSAKNEDNVEMNDYRLAGIQAAIMFKQQIGGNDADISELKRQIGELKNKKDTTKEDKDLLKSLEKKLFENKFDRITMYENLLNNVQRMVKESKGRAKEFREEIAEHKNEILHRANLDLEGVDSTYYDTTTAKKKFVNNDLQRAVFSSTYTFEQFLKFFGKHSANGEGRLYNYFHKLNQDALDEEQLYNEMNRNALDEKTKELFGKEKFMKLVGIDGKGMKEMDVEVTDYSNKETGKRTIHLKQGQMLYIYLVNKETDGEMKLRAMGITEEDVAAIEENLDPRVKAMGEWLQDEYLPECQRRYQATHTKYFGAPMKEVENYFPLAINNRARNVKEDVNQDSDAMSQLAGTSTGAIVTRRVNVIPLDIENADAFEVAFNHLQEMEEWSAMLPFRQDINTLLSYTHFRNQVQNMSSVAYGSGKTLWDEFKQTAQIAAGTYKPKVNAGMMDSRIAAAMGGIAVAKISGRLWTAIKQSQSATVFLPECDFTRFVKNGVNPYGSWKWAMENIPDFRKRVENMTYGDVKLRQYLDELEKWHDWTKTISKIGMAPNILVDGITCAVGARSVYETEVNRLTKLGYQKEKAEEKAYYKAVAAYNKTQQSSGGMYLSPMQVDRTYVSAALSLFKNANYAYGRMQIEACRGLARTYDFWGGKHKTALIESMTRQIMEEDGLDENTARAIAKATYKRTFRQSIGRLINFATLVPISWALYKVLPYLLTGDDDDKKTDMIEEGALKGFATSLSDNYVIPFASNILNAGLKVEDGKPTFDPEVFRYQNLYINPATSDLANIYSMIGNQKWYSVANKLGMLGVQSLIGFNPETVGALYQAFAEADYDNGNTAKEWQIGILKAISAPEESIRELYMDELGLKSGDIKKIPLAELEKRYAERQINRDNLLSQIGMDAETFNGYVDKYQKSFEKKIKDKMDKWDEYDKKKADEFFDTTSDPKLKDMIEKKRAKDANAAADEQIAKEGLNQEKKGKEPSEVAYDAVKMSIDVAEDNAISTYNKVLNKRYAALNDEYNNQTDAMKYIFMSNHPNFKAYKELESEYTNYGKKMKELKEKLVSAKGYDVKQTILKQIRAEREKFSELQSKVR